MTNFDDTDDFDALVDKAVDTFFVEAPSEEELSLEDNNPPPADVAEEKPPVDAPPPAEGYTDPGLDKAVDSLFMSSFKESPAETSYISSGDQETDRAIDLAVDTLFVEEPDTPAPDTAALDAEVVALPPEEETIEAYVIEDDDEEPETEEAPGPPNVSYDDMMAQEIERHMHSLFTGSEQKADQQSQKDVETEVAPSRVSAESPLRDLQEAILTLEWEISKRSVTALASELRRVRQRFQDNVTVDFAAISMRLVLDYVIKRMAKAHPESIRFLLEVTDFLEKSLTSSEVDPLRAFHHILNRYESYKSLVRKAEGLPDRKPAILDELEIRNPERFSKLVEAQAMTLIRAAYSLAKRIDQDSDPETLIRSFRFLVNRSANRILENTQSREKRTKVTKRKRPTHNSAR